MEQLKPDVVIVAVGAEPAKPNIPGTDKGHVVQAVDIYADPSQLKGNVAIIGGGTVGIEMGLYIADLGYSCNVIEMTDEIAASEIHGVWKYALRWKMKQYPALRTHTGTVCKEIRDGEVIVEKDGEKQSITANTVILATGFIPRQEEADSFYNIAYHTFKIGDCYRVRKLWAATNEGFHRLLNL